MSVKVKCGLRAKIAVAACCVMALCGAAEALTCAACGDTISSSYYEHGGRAYCSGECLETVMPKCENCGRVIKSGGLVMCGQYFCSEKCVDSVREHCDVCGGVIRGRFFNAGGKKACSERCALSVSPKCDACGRPFLRGGVARKTNGNSCTLCADCAGKPSCFFCGMPAANRVSAAISICDDCNLTSASVASRAELQKKIARVTSIVTNVLGVGIGCDCPVKFVPYAELMRLAGGGVDSTDAGLELGLFRCETSADFSGMVTRGTCRIYILDCVPMSRFEDALAHEVAHHWAAHQSPELQRSRQESEGFAEYIAAIVDSVNGDGMMIDQKREAKDQVYGGGYRKWEERLGRPRKLGPYNFGEFLPRRKLRKAKESHESLRSWLPF